VEIHRDIWWLHTNIRQIAERIPCRYVHRAAQACGQQSEIAAHADSPLKHVHRRHAGVAASGSIAHLAVHPVANRLYSRPAGLGCAKQLPGNRHQQVGLDKAARQRVHEHRIRDVGNAHQRRVGNDLIRRTRDGDERVVAYAEGTGRRREPPAGVAERVDVIYDADLRLRPARLVLDPLIRPRLRPYEHQHGYRSLSGIRELAPHPQPHTSQLTQFGRTAPSSLYGQS